ncbi:hypothetical protein [Variovorax sp. LG9.2]|uniref:hypothetical protein n=1 Tax=Variovorax sp. LG9.2 TaxID=3048626 RepID=UPI002B22640D|nr:hypothetical protein [Variovorax sp. LG9.2]MEB0056488.1 hypothetical protein [Variovorax sp. LG9.2]
MHDLLIIEKDEFRLALQEPRDAVDQHLGWADATVLYRVQRVLAIAVPHMLANERLQLFAVGMQKQGRAVKMIAVVRVIDLAITRVVVQVGAGLQGHTTVLHCGVEVLQEGGVRPSLIRRMRAFALACATSAVRPDDRVLVAAAGRRPLLELDDHDFGSGVRVFTGDDEVDPLGGLRQLIFDRNANVLRDLLVQQYLGHRKQRMLPCLKFGRTDAVARGATELAFHHVFDVVSKSVVKELALVGLVDDHVGAALTVRRTSCCCRAPGQLGTLGR